MLTSMIESWAAHLGARGYERFEMVLCNDGSTDGSDAILAALQHRFPELRVVTHRPNRGGGAAMASAIRATTCDWVLLIDGDGQFPIACIDALEAALDRASIDGDGGGEPIRAVFGARARKQDSAFARAGSLASSAACNLVYGTRWRDFNSTCRLVDGALLRRLPIEVRGLNYSTEITARLVEAGVPIAETTIAHAGRDRSRSHRAVARAAWQRLLFVSYLGARRLLLAQGVLRPADRDAPGDAAPNDDAAAPDAVDGRRAP